MKYRFKYKKKTPPWSRATANLEPLSPQGHREAIEPGLLALSPSLLGGRVAGLPNYSLVRVIGILKPECIKHSSEEHPVCWMACIEGCENRSFYPRIRLSGIWGLMDI